MPESFHIHSEQADIIIKRIAACKSANGLKKVLKQRVRREIGLGGRRLPHAFLPEMLALRVIHVGKTIGEQENAVPRQNVFPGRLVPDILMQAQCGTGTAVGDGKIVDFMSLRP